MNDHWELFICTIGSDRASIFVNVAVQETLNQKAPALLVKVCLAHQEAYVNGLPQPNDSHAINKLEARLSGFADERGDWYVGHLTVAGYRNYYIYTATAKEVWLEELGALQQALGLALEVTFHHDPNHCGYWNNLFPTENDWQVIEDLRIVQALVEYGDDGSEPRRVDHWVFFEDPKAAEEFVAWATANRYIYQPDQSYRTDDGRYCVRFCHHSTIVIDEISSHTIEISRKAAELGGDYDGWETAILSADC